MIYSVDEISHRGYEIPNVDRVRMESRVMYCSIEFLHITKKGKQPVYFRVKTLTDLEYKNKKKYGTLSRYQVCRFSTNPMDDCHNPLDLHIQSDVMAHPETGIPQWDLSKDAVAGFYVKVMRRHDIKLKDWLTMLDNKSGLVYEPDLTRFSFTGADGYRDFVCQAFARLYKKEVLDSTVIYRSFFHYYELVQGDKSITYGKKFEGSYFTEIIGKRFERQHDGNFVVLRVLDSPIRKGKFLNTSFSRSEYIKEGSKRLLFPYLEQAVAHHGRGSGGKPPDGTGDDTSEQMRNTAQTTDPSHPVAEKPRQEMVANTEAIVTPQIGASRPGLKPSVPGVDASARNTSRTNAMKLQSDVPNGSSQSVPSQAVPAQKRQENKTQGQVRIEAPKTQTRQKVGKMSQKA